jgi:hypothetical protein
MPLGDAYLTVAEFKARSRSTTTANDDAIAAVLESASRSIDGYCGREFNKSAAPESRVFDCVDGYAGRWGHAAPFVDEAPHGWQPCIATGDIVSVTSIASGDGTGAYPDPWDADSYALLPRNAAAKGFPFTEIGPPVGRWSGWPLTTYGVQLTGIFGWPSVPAPVKEATFLIANRLKSAWDAPFGSSGGGEMGALNMTMSISPLIAEMLNAFRVRTI